MRRLQASPFPALALLLALACTTAPVRREVLPDELVARLQSPEASERESAAT